MIDGLAELKSCLISEQALKDQINQLNSEKAALDLDCLAKESKISDIAAQLQSAQEKGSALNARISALETERDSLKHATPVEGRETRHSKATEATNANLRIELQKLSADIARESGKHQLAVELAESLRKECEQAKVCYHFACFRKTNN